MQTDDDPIAVVGFSLRFPQDADSTESFWEMLSQGKNAMTDFPSTKFNIDAFHGRKGAMNGTVCPSSFTPPICLGISPDLMTL